MQRLLAVAFGPGLASLTLLVSALLGPTLRAFALDYATLAIVFGHVADRAMGGTPVYAAVGQYSEADVADMVDGITGLLAPVLTEYQLVGVVTAGQLATLLGAVADRAASAPAAP